MGDWTYVVRLFDAIYIVQHSAGDGIRDCRMENILMPAFSRGNPPRKVSDISTIVISELELDGRADKIIYEHSMSWSDDPEVYGATAAEVPTYIVQAVMGKDEFMTARSAMANRGVHVSYRYSEFRGLRDKFVYSLFAKPWNEKKIPRRY